MTERQTHRERGPQERVKKKSDNRVPKESRYCPISAVSERGGHEDSQEKKKKMQMKRRDK